MFNIIPFIRDIVPSFLLVGPVYWIETVPIILRMRRGDNVYGPGTTGRRRKRMKGFFVRPKSAIVFLCILAGRSLGADVPLFGIFEETVTNNKNYENKFRDVNLDVEYTSPSDRKVQFFGFFDGDGTGGGDRLDVHDFPPDNAGEISGTVWKMRFMPDEPGVWQYSWSFSDNSKSGTGTFTCTDEGGRRGVLKVLGTNPHWLEDDRGDPFFPKTIYIRPGEQLAYPISRSRLRQAYRFRC